MREAGTRTPFDFMNRATGMKIIMKKAIIVVLAGPFSLTACAQAAPRSSEYFAAHLDEARQVVAGCRDGTVRGEECANANRAVEEAKAKERFRRFRGR